MEFRNKEEIKLNLEIKMLSQYNQKDKEKIERFTDNTSNGEEYNKKQISKSLNDIKERENKIIEYKNRIVDLKQGKLDKELQQELVTNKNKANTSQKFITKKINKEKQDIMESMYTVKVKEDNKLKSTKNMKKDYDREYKNYVYNSNSLPKYIIKSLENMPSNKGYIWRDIWFFGKLPRDSDVNRTLFEPIEKDLLMIHEWTESQYKLFEKIGKDKKKLVRVKNIYRRVLNDTRIPN
jgi:hypothetical protein